MDVGVTHGAYRRQVDNAENRPYWKYVAVMDQRTRAAHAAMNGKVFRADDPIWKTHYPPNGFGCRCVVIALSERDMERQGLTVSDSEGHLKQVEQEAGVNKRTGEVVTVRGTQYRFTGKDGKSRVMTPDPGWSYNPGHAGGGPAGTAPAGASASRVVGAESRILVKSANQAPPQVARDMVRETVMSDRFAEAFEGDALRDWPLAVVPETVLRSLSKGGVRTGAQVVTCQVKRGKLPRQHPEVGVEQMRLLQQTLDRGEVIREKPGRALQLKRNTLLVHYQDDDDIWWRYAINIRETGLALATVFHDTTGQARDAVFKEGRNIVMLRDWDAARWRDDQ